jgi:hypothetical protein
VFLFRLDPWGATPQQRIGWQDARTYAALIAALHATLRVTEALTQAVSALETYRGGDTRVLRALREVGSLTRKDPSSRILSL